MCQDLIFERKSLGPFKYSVIIACKPSTIIKSLDFECLLLSSHVLKDNSFLLKNSIVLLGMSSYMHLPNFYLWVIFRIKQSENINLLNLKSNLKNIFLINKSFICL